MNDDKMFSFEECIKGETEFLYKFTKYIVDYINKIATSDPMGKAVTHYVLITNNPHVVRAPKMISYRFND